jgi:hypothetical protein
MTPEIATYEGEQAVRAYALKQAEDFTFWRDYHRNVMNAESTAPNARAAASEKARVYSEAAKALTEVVRLIDETRSERMTAKGLPDL